MEYTSFISIDDVKAKGYDLMAPGRLNLGDFTTLDDAASDFLQECFNTIYELIEAKNGPEWTENFFKDMSGTIDSTTYPRAARLQKALKRVILLQTIFIFENGDVSDSAEDTENKKIYSPKAMRLLYSNQII